MNYIITQITPVSWDVYNESNETLYRVDNVYSEKNVNKYVCNCPHYYYRLRGSGGQCKHILMVKEKINASVNRKSSRIVPELFGF